MRLLLVVVLFFLMTSNDHSTNNQVASFDYGTENDSARFYYLKGFHEILDNGRWTEAEICYRKALEFDTNYLLDKSVVGRITRNLEERETILREVLKNMDTAPYDEKLIQEVYALGIEAYNNRDKGIKGTPEFNAKRRQTAEANFCAFVQKYPEDDYVKAEYIEWLHFIHGPEAALDSLKKLATYRQQRLGFYISYAASLELELGNIDNALVLSENLKPIMLDTTYTTYLKLKAEIYMAQDSLEKAKEYIDKVVRIDPNHIIALGMQSELKNRLKHNYRTQNSYKFY